MAASYLMRLLHWLANPSNRAMSTHTEGKRTSQTDIIYTVERREGGGGGGGNNTETMLEGRMALANKTQGIRTHVNNRRSLTAQVYQH